VDVTLVGGCEGIAEPGVLPSLVRVVNIIDRVGGPIAGENPIRRISQIAKAHNVDLDRAQIENVVGRVIKDMPPSAVNDQR
jgi:hypothetical protein